MPGRTVTLTWTHRERLQAPAKYRRACRYDAFVPGRLADLELHLPAARAGRGSEAEGAIRELNAGAKPALRPLARLLLRTESIASSKVEGLQVDARELARAEAKLETGGRAGPTALEVLANVDAMELAVEESAHAEAFGPAEIGMIHRMLMTNTANAPHAGRFREEQNWIGGNDYNPCGADFVPPPPEHVEPLVHDLCDYVNDDLHPPMIQAALVHAQFETIHPFHDGNGRTGRALVHVVLRRRGVAPAYVPPISVVLAASRDGYIDGLTGYRGDGLVAWLDHCSAAAARSARLAAMYLQAVRDLSETWRAQLAESGHAPRADGAAWAVIEQLPAHPILTAPVAAAATDRSKPAIYQALEQLETAGVLLPLSRARRNRAWEAAGLLDLLARLEAGEMNVTSTSNRQ